MAYRVIQWATGRLGTAAVGGIVGHRDLELVGAWVHGALKSSGNGTEETNALCETSGTHCNRLMGFCVYLS